MKKKKYLILTIIFILILSCILICFNKIYFKTDLYNKTNRLLEYLYIVEDEGDFDLKNGVVYKDKEIMNGKVFLDGNGKINIDKYGNVKFLINSNDKCISKTSLGSIKITKGRCGDFKNIKVKIIKNNSNISFETNENDLEYKLSKNDDFKGEWIHDNYDKNIIIKSFRENDNFIWFKDSEGNISDVNIFNVSCLDTNNTKYSSNVFYCSGSTIILDNIEWVVLEDTNNRIKLMKYEPIDKKLSHCLTEKSNFCYYTKKENSSYSWSKSYINYYLNYIFINSLSEEIQKKLIVNNICDDYDTFNCNKDSCGGYSKEEINYYNYSCSKYTESKIKLISYDEYNYVYFKSKNRRVLNGNYWAINSYSKDKGSVVQGNYEYYILENPTSKLDIKPVILIEK